MDILSQQKIVNASNFKHEIIKKISSSWPLGSKTSATLHDYPHENE